MAILYDFNCEHCGATFEGLAKLGANAKKCPHCGSDAKRVPMAMPHIRLDGTDPAFSTAWDRWAKVHEAEHKRAIKRDDFGGKYRGDN